MSTDDKHRDDDQPWWAVAFPEETGDPADSGLHFDFEVTPSAQQAGWDDADFANLDFTQWLDPDDVEPVEDDDHFEELLGIEAEVIELSPERRRDGQRVAHTQPVVMVRRGDRQKAVMHNLSPRGLVVTSDCTGQPGSHVGVEVPVGRGGVSLETEVRWVRLQDNAAEAFQIGLRVINPPAAWLAYYEQCRWPQGEIALSEAASA